MIQNVDALVEKKRKWETKLDIELSMTQFNKKFNRIWPIMNINKLRSFQYKLLHYAITMNRRRHTCDKEVDSLCVTIVKKRKNQLWTYSVIALW